MSSVVRNRLNFIIIIGHTYCVRKCKKNGYREFDHSSTLTLGRPEDHDINLGKFWKPTTIQIGCTQNPTLDLTRESPKNISVIGQYIIVSYIKGTLCDETTPQRWALPNIKKH